MAPFLPLSAAYAVVLAVTRGFGTMVPAAIIDKLGRAAAQPIFVLAVVITGLRTRRSPWHGPCRSRSGWWRPSYGWAACCAITQGSRTPGPAERATGRGRAVFIEFWMFTAPRGLASMFAVIILWLDTLLIGALGSTAQAGMFAAATRYLAFGQFIGVAIIQVVGPKLSEVLAAHDLGRARVVYSTATWWLMALAWPLYLTMIVLAPSLLSFFGPAYQQADTVLVILGASMLVATLVGPVDMVLLMAGKSSWNLLNTIAAIVANVTLNLILIPRYGMTGAAVAWSASILVEQPLAAGAGLAADRPAPVRPRDRSRSRRAPSSVSAASGRCRPAPRPRHPGTRGHRARRRRPVPVALWRFRKMLHLPVLLGSSSKQVGSIGTARHPLGQLPHADLGAGQAQGPRAYARGLCPRRSYVITGPMKPVVPRAGSSVQKVTEKVSLPDRPNCTVSVEGPIARPVADTMDSVGVVTFGLLKRRTSI